jgi:hypothetical protein
VLKESTGAGRCTVLSRTEKEMKHMTQLYDMIDPKDKIHEQDRLLFIRFVQKAPAQVIVLSREGVWKWYEIAFRFTEQKPYVIPTATGEKETIPVLCEDGDLVGIYWADPDLLPPARIETLAGGPCLRLPALPLYLQEAGFWEFCTRAGYALEMIYCAYCQDILPISGLVPETEQVPCLHVRWCPTCGVWSTPNYPGKEDVVDPCPHRSADDLLYVPPATGTASVGEV